MMLSLHNTYNVHIRNEKEKKSIETCKVYVTVQRMSGVQGSCWDIRETPVTSRYKTGLSEAAAIVRNYLAHLVCI